MKHHLFHAVNWIVKSKRIRVPTAVNASPPITTDWVIHVSMLLLWHRQTSGNSLIKSWSSGDDQRDWPDVLRYACGRGFSYCRCLYPLSSSWNLFPLRNRVFRVTRCWTVWRRHGPPARLSVVWRRRAGDHLITDQVGNVRILPPNICWVVAVCCRYSALWWIYWWSDQLIETETNCWIWWDLVGVLLVSALIIYLTDWWFLIRLLEELLEIFSWRDATRDVMNSVGSLIININQCIFTKRII